MRTNTTGRSTDRELPTTGRGFGAWKKAAQQSGGSDFNDFTVEEGKKLVVAFLEDGPFAVVWVHWVPTTNDQGRSYNTPRNCPASKDDAAECALCDRGIESKPVAWFNVADLEDPSKVYLWKAGKDAAGRVEKLFDELQAVPADRGGPLELNAPGVYAEVSKEKQKNGRFAYAVKRVKERDLDEDYALAPLQPDEVTALLGKLYDESAVRYSSGTDLKELADAVED